MQSQKRLKNKLISAGATVLLLVALVCCVFFTLQSISTGYVSFGGVSVFRVVTGSMEPEISVGALLAAQKVDIETIKERDIVCYRATAQGVGKVVITHRVVGVGHLPDGSTVLQTKGDANLTADAEYVSQAQLIGRVIWHTGDGSFMARVLQFLTSDFGFLACILLPVILIAIWICRDAIKNMKKAIQDVEEQLQAQEKQEKVTISAEEYAQMVAKVQEEVRKELEQDAAQSVQSNQKETASAVGQATQDPPASATETPR